MFRTGGNKIAKNSQTIRNDYHGGQRRATNVASIGALVLLRRQKLTKTLHKSIKSLKLIAALALELLQV